MGNSKKIREKSYSDSFPVMILQTTLYIPVRNSPLTLKASVPPLDLWLRLSQSFDAS